MLKQLLGYFPSNIIPAAVSFAIIYLYTRLLTPAEFGSYSFVFSCVLFVQASLFYAFPVAITRFYPEAERLGRPGVFLKEAYIVFLALSLALIVVMVIVDWVVVLPQQYRLGAGIALPMIVFRSSVLMNQSVNRASNNMLRFNLVECAHAIIGCVFGVALIYLWKPTGDAVLIGLLGAAILCTLVDLRLLLTPLRRGIGPIDRAAVIRLLNFGWPLITVALISCLLTLSDRFLLGTLSSVEMLGIYSVAMNLVERPTTLICNAISTATFPYAVQLMEQKGREAGSIQVGKNGAVLLALMLPACLGLALTSPYIAAAMVGPEFREGVASLIPILCYTALCRGVRSHLIDHSYHMAGRPNMMMWTYAPAAAANIILNLVLIPSHGVMGAAYAGLVCQVGTVIGGWIIGQRLFPIHLPWAQVARIIVAVIPMVLVLTLVDFQENWLGLVEAIGSGAGLFVASMFLLDVGGVRTSVQSPIRAVLAR